MNAATETAQPSAHPFRAFGPGPYKLLGVDTTEDRKARNSERKGMGQTYTTNMCGGTCDLCSTAIWDVYRFRCADGTTFKVGSTCMLKNIPEGTKTHRVFKKKVAEVNRKKKAARDAARIERLALHLATDAVRAELAAKPHSNNWRAEQGDTMLDECEWLMKNAGVSGKIKLARRLKVK